MATMKQFSSKRDIRRALRILQDQIEAHQSPLLEHEDLGHLQIELAPMTFTADGNYDPPFHLNSEDDELDMRELSDFDQRADTPGTGT